MFKRFITILLLVTLISSNFSSIMVYAGFKMNQKYIAETICINKSRPWMHCNGQCYFKKKVLQAEENEKKQQAKGNLNRMEVSFFQKPFQLSFVEPIIIETIKSSFPTYTYWYSSRYIETIFRPPRQIA